MMPALMPTYARADLAFERGEGAWLVTADGRRFLDFGAGIATSSLGHGHPHLVQAIAEQAARVMHVSNLYRVPGAERFAHRMISETFADSIFLCNSGAEANEGMVKLVRRAMFCTGRPERTRMICFDGAFHGRTLAMLSATGNAKYLAGYGTAVDGFDHVPFGNMNALRDAITPQTAGVLVEPIQGEGGVRVPPPGFLADLRAACDEFGIYLALDEVQCGMGRTGKLFAYQHSGIVPDALSAAKGIAGGFPMGAILAREELARHMTPGTHGTTFGGNPLACAAANAVLDVMLAPGFLDNVTATGGAFATALTELVHAMPAAFEGVRGQGLMLGLRCAVPNTDMQAACLQEQLLTVAAGDNTLRLVPPLTVTVAECLDAVSRLRRAALRVLPALHGVAAK
jgi:acetylornithine/N-succinyldiaminopimelate aminotransferase